MRKLLRCNKKFGRCPLHGDKCGITQEIQSIEITRSKEKAELRKEIQGEVAERFNALPC